MIHHIRTAARDFRRHGVWEGEIMKLCGWKTRAMFDRHNLIDEADLTGCAASRTARPLLVGSIPTGASLRHKDLRGFAPTDWHIL